jgi:hypothetical protein
MHDCAGLIAAKSPHAEIASGYAEADVVIIEALLNDSVGECTRHCSLPDT